MASNHCCAKCAREVACRTKPRSKYYCNMKAMALLGACTDYMRLLCARKAKSCFRAASVEDKRQVKMFTEEKAS